MKIIRFFLALNGTLLLKENRVCLVKNFAEFITLYRFSDYFLPGNGWVVFFLILSFAL